MKNECLHSGVHVSIYDKELSLYLVNNYASQMFSSRSEIFTTKLKAISTAHYTQGKFPLFSTQPQNTEYVFSLYYH